MTQNFLIGGFMVQVHKIEAFTSTSAICLMIYLVSMPGRVCLNAANWDDFSLHMLLEINLLLLQDLSTGTSISHHGTCSE